MLNFSKIYSPGNEPLESILHQNDFNNLKEYSYTLGTSERLWQTNLTVS